MPRFTGDEQVVFSAKTGSFEVDQGTAPVFQLDPAVTGKVANFAFFLDEIEECTNALRRDQIEQVIAQAVATCGFTSSCEARAALEWMFRKPPALS